MLAITAAQLPPAVRDEEHFLPSSGIKIYPDSCFQSWRRIEALISNALRKATEFTDFPSRERHQNLENG